MPGTEQALDKYLWTTDEKCISHRLLEGSDGVQGGRGCGPFLLGARKLPPLISRDGQRVRPKGSLHIQSPDPTLSTPASKREGQGPKEWRLRGSTAPELTGWGRGKGDHQEHRACGRGPAIKVGAFRSEDLGWNHGKLPFPSESLGFFFFFSWKKKKWGDNKMHM